MPSPEELARYYPASYYGNESKKFVPVIELLSRTVRKILRSFFLKRFSGHRAFLEIGCGRGDLLAELAKMGWECHGTEYGSSPSMSNKHLGKCVIHNKQNLRDANFSDNYFDMVVIRHVLEHLPNPEETIQEISRILKPGGGLYLVVPNYDGYVSSLFGSHWFALDVPRHLFHFTPQCLSILLNKYSLRIKKQSFLSFEQDVFTFAQSAQNYMGFTYNGLYDLIRNDSARLSSKAAISQSEKWLILVTGAILSVAGFFISLFSAIFRTGGVIEIYAVRDRKDNMKACRPLASYLSHLSD
ncbi:MAG: hypothetical protein ACD_39C01155G0002 [uncultured bacterium]|nr:MAG: hypothetical protein ACD_39C01155G0002 [uncultured bacterium]